MQNALLAKFISKNKREKEFPEFRPGDTIKVHVKIKEGEKERLQAFEGVLIARNGAGMGESITVQGQFRPGRGAYLPGTRQGSGPYRCRPHRPRTPRQAVLSARLKGQGRPSERARLVSVSPCGRLRRVANSVVTRHWSESCAHVASMPLLALTKWAAAHYSVPSSPAL